MACLTTRKTGNFIISHDDLIKSVSFINLKPETIEAV